MADYQVSVSLGGVPNPTGWYSVKAYGAVGDGVTNDTVAVQAAINAAGVSAGGVVLIDKGTFICSPAMTVPDGVSLRGAGKRASVIKRAATGDLFGSIGSNVSIYDMTIDGETTSCGAGRGILIGAGKYGQFMSNVEVTDFSESCLEFAGDAGSTFTAVACTFYTTQTPGTGAAVKVNGADTGAIPRHFYGCESGGCTLFDFGDSANFVANGGYTNGLIWGTGSTHTFVSDMRIGAVGGTVTTKGGAHRLTSCIFAVPLIVDSINTYVHSEVPDYDITDTGYGNEIYIPATAYTPSWTSSGTAPSLGNGIITGVYTRQGRLVTAVVNLGFGASTTPGTGTWRFSLPQLDMNSYIHVGGGGQTGGSSAGNWSLSCLVVPGTAYAQIYRVDTNAALSGTTQTWAADTTVRITVSYFVP